MQEAPYTNRQPHNVWIGGVCIPPGETAIVDARFAPAAPASPTAPAAAPSDPVLALLDRKIPQIEASLPGLDADALDRLERAERDGKTRKGVLEAIAAERLTRARAGQESPPGGE